MHKSFFIIILLFFLHSCKEEFIPNNFVYKKTSYYVSNPSQIMWERTYEYDEQFRTHKINYSSSKYTQYYYESNTPNNYTISYVFKDHLSAWSRSDSTYYLYDGVRLIKKDWFVFDHKQNIINNFKYVHKYKNNFLHKINEYLNGRFRIGSIFLYDSIGNCIKEEFYGDSLFSKPFYYTIHEYDGKNRIQSNIYVSLRTRDELNFKITYEYDLYSRLIWEICEEKYDEGIQLFGPYIFGYEYFN